jgi:hypothetical protein
LKRRKGLFDVIVVAAVLAIGGVGYLAYSGVGFGGSEGEETSPREADIYKGSELIETVSLDTDRDIEIGPAGARNLIRISGGKISVAEADCPDKTCVHTGAKSRAGDMIVCLPNRLQIMIRGGDGGEEDDGVDAVSG